MNKILLILLLLVFISPSALAYKDQHTIKAFVADGLIKTSPVPSNVKIYKVTFQATAATASFGIYDCSSKSDESNTTIKIEGSEATAGNGKCYDFSDNPIEFSTGAYIDLESMNLVIEYD